MVRKSCSDDLFLREISFRDKPEKMLETDFARN
jgi:hypothetical protein